MIRAIIFDCFGVLTSDGWSPFKKRHFSDDSKKESEASDLSKRLNSGSLSYDGFVDEIARLANVPTAEAQQAIVDNVANEELLDYIRDTLKPQYKLGLLSNAGRNMLSELFSEEQIALFDQIALSYDTGVMKPNSRAYTAVAEQLGVDPKDCVFVDDQERYCTAARDTGMQAIWYQNFDQFKKELKDLL